MSWLSGGLNQFSNITDQITSFTKEVLTETTEEVTDPSAELQVLRQKHDEVVKSHRHLQTELEKLKQHSDEHKERAETAEYQISTISQEYRKVIENRDAEIRHLKTENVKLRDQAKGLVYANTSEPNSPLKELALLQLGGSDIPSSQGPLDSQYESIDIGGSNEWVESYHDDFSDIISSQSEINRLQMELSKVRLEAQHWKTMVEDKNLLSAVDSADHSYAGSISKEQVEHLSLDQHQQELTSLQAAHHKRTHSLSQRHQEEIRQLQEQIDNLQMKLEQQRTKEDPQRETKRELEELNSSLCSQLNQLKSEYRKEQGIKMELQQQLEREEASKLELAGEIKLLTDRHLQEKLAQEHLLNQEKENLKIHLNEMQERILDHQKNMSTLQEAHQKCKQESKSLQGQVDILTNQLSEKDREISTLKGKQQDERYNRDQGDKLLKEVVEEKARELKDLVIVGEELEIQEEAQMVKCSQMQDKNSATEIGSNLSSTDMETLLAQVKGELNYYKKVFDDKTIELNKAVTERSNIEALLSVKENEIKSLVDTLESCKQNEIQNKAIIGKLQADKDEAVKVLETLQTEAVSLRGMEDKEIMKKEERFLAIQQENIKYSKQLANLKTHLIDVEEQYTQEAVRADEREANLKQQMASLQDQLVTSRSRETMLIEQNRQQVLGLEEELKAVNDERDDALLKMTNAQEQAKLNAESMRNLQTVLEEFQRDQSSELAQALKKSKLELADALTECQHLKIESDSIKVQLEEANEAAKVASILHQELEEKEATITNLSQEVEALRASMDDQPVKKSRDEDKSMVDRNLVKNLMLGYFHAGDRKKHEVLHLIAKILEFSPKELNQAASEHHKEGGWLTGLWRTTPIPSQPKSPSSLSRLFIEFLESESSPQNPSTSAQSMTKDMGYIDPHTDPDKPSLSTASLFGSMPLPTLENISSKTDLQSRSTVPLKMHCHDSELGKGIHIGRNDTKKSVQINETQIASNVGQKYSFQSSLLKSVLAE